MIVVPLLEQRSEELNRSEAQMMVIIVVEVFLK
jgi:hypothetical protein